MSFWKTSIFVCSIAICIAAGAVPSLAFQTPLGTVTSNRATVQRMTPELLWKLGRIAGAAFNHDGTKVAYAVRKFDLAEDNGITDLHVLDLQEGTDKQLLAGWVGVDSLQWIGKETDETLWFSAMEKRGDSSGMQAWRIPVATWEKQQVSQIPDGIANLKVAPTGQQIAFSRDIKLDQTVNELYPDLPKANARIIDGLMYRHWNAWHDFAWSHLFVAAVNADGTLGTAKDLMEGLQANCPVPPFGGSEQFAWSPDGKELAYTIKNSPRPAESTDTEVFLYTVGSDQPAQLISPEMPGYDNDPAYSPNGRYILFHSMARPGFEADRNRIMIYDRQQKNLREASLGLDQNCQHSQWGPDSETIYFVSEHRGTEQIFSLNAAGHSLRQLTQGAFNWQLFGISADGKTALVGKQNMLRPQELHTLNLGDGADQKITQINDSIYENLTLPKVEERWVEATDGKSIHCWVLHPPEFDPESDVKWPMLTFCQGGPQGQVSQAFSYRWNFHLMASQGYVVLAPNRRGLPGFGREWNDQISGDWGGQAMQDLLSATDNMAKEPYVDRKRMAAVGASFGGYTVYWMMGNHRDRFCTMISHCGVFNLESMYGTTEELFFVNWDLGGPYWETDKAKRDYQRFSPHQFVGNWKTPLLVIHGEKDFRVPVSQGMEAFTAAQTQGVPSRFLYFPEEGHWVMRPQNSVLWQRVFFDWLEKYCKNKS